MSVLYQQTAPNHNLTPPYVQKVKFSSVSQTWSLLITEVMAGEPELDWSLSLGATGPGPIGLRQGLQTLFSCFHQPCPVLLCTASYCHGSSSRLGTLAPLLWLWFLCSGHTREGLDTQRTVSLCATKMSLSVLLVYLHPIIVDRLVRKRGVILPAVYLFLF